MLEKPLFYLGRDLPLKRNILPRGLEDSCSDFFLLDSFLKTCKSISRKHSSCWLTLLPKPFPWISIGYRIKIKFAFKAFCYPDSAHLLSGLHWQMWHMTRHARAQEQFIFWKRVAFHKPICLKSLMNYAVEYLLAWDYSIHSLLLTPSKKQAIKNKYKQNNIDI